MKHARYEFSCPGCNSLYIGKTNRTLFVRTQKHALTDKESAIYKHLRHYEQIKHIQGLYNLPYIFITEHNLPFAALNKEFLTQTVRGNTQIIDRDDNWNLLLFKEAYHIKRSEPSLNIGLKASRELCLFSYSPLLSPILHVLINANVPSAVFKSLLPVDHLSLKMIYIYLYNNPSYSRILIGSCLWSIRGQTHDWRHH